MWGKVLTVLVVTGIIGAVTFLGWRVVVAYGDARYAAGKADAQVAQIPAIRAADARAMEIAVGTRDQVIASQNLSMSELARITALALASNEKVTAYAQTAAGMAACLAPDRVLGIEADRATLFPPAAPSAPSEGAAGPVPANVLPDAFGPQPQ
jgi:hypothetical protein